MWLFIQPQDTLFFRDGRPFNAGADVWTNTVFPPYPHTVYGMLRTLFAHCFLEQPDYNDLLAGIQDEETSRFLGTKATTGALAIRGPFVGRKMGNRANMLLSAPSDLFELPATPFEKSEVHYVMAPTRQKDITAFSDMHIPFLPLAFADLEEGTKAEVLKPVSRMVSDASILNYLKGATAHNKAAIRSGIHQEDFITEEICPIIARDENLSAREGHLALPQHIRMQAGSDLQYEERGLLVKIDGGIADSLRLRIEDYLRARPVIRLGGEGRVAMVEMVDCDDAGIHAAFFPIMAETGKFRTVLTSPAYFPQNAFFPDFLNKDLLGDWNLGGEPRRVRLVAATMSRAQPVGSWDIAAIRPRETVNMVPAGSVFFFELVEYDRQKDEKWMLNLARHSFPGAIPGGEESYMKKGFNTFIIGAWDYVS